MFQVKDCSPKQVLDLGTTPQGACCTLAWVSVPNCPRSQGKLCFEKVKARDDLRIQTALK